jgi:hypothetical protein
MADERLLLSATPCQQTFVSLSSATVRVPSGFVSMYLVMMARCWRRRSKSRWIAQLGYPYDARYADKKGAKHRYVTRDEAADPVDGFTNHLVLLSLSLSSRLASRSLWAVRLSGVARSPIRRG